MSLAWAEAAEAGAWLVGLARQPGHGTHLTHERTNLTSKGKAMDRCFDLINILTALQLLGYNRVQS